MRFTVEDMMKNAFALVSGNGDSDYARFCHRMRVAGFDSMPRRFDHEIPYCILKDDIQQHCTLNHYFMVKMAKALGLDHITVFEFDAYPMIDCRHELDMFFDRADIPDDADIVLFGNLMWIRDDGTRLSGVTSTVPYGHIARKQWGAQVVTYFKRGYDRYINNFVGLPLDTRCNADHWWRLTNNTYHTYRSFFIQAKDGVEHLNWLCDSEHLSDFPPLVPFA